MNELLFFLVIGSAAGLLAAIAMNWPMRAWDDGFTPAYVAAAVATRRSPESVPFRDAVIAHHVAGVLAGALYGVLVTGLGRTIPAAVSLSLSGVEVAAHVVATAIVVGFIYLLFAHIVLPHAGGQIYEEQSTAVRGQWLRSSLIFGVTMTVAVPVLATTVVA
ncbi:hypothetical protein [Halalkalirubrum salinum]|uniref:hypothetical protein n=1 Tax=Halalkalirubrum salinum TaxID=2563889 RepID=UPI0010FB4D23|nr:hypothetical protein [Halalkalirubrum salinum]